MKAKIISYLGIVAAVAMAVAPQLTSMNPKTAQWVLLAGTLATALGAALTRFLSASVWPTVIGVLLAAAGVITGANGLIGSRWAFGAGVVGTVLAALGRSLFGWLDAVPSEPSIQPREWRD